MQTHSDPSLGEVTRVFAKIGFLSFGGPAGQIALMHRELVEERDWLDEPRFLHALNYCMMLPGPEAMQLATYAGWLLKGTLGGLIAGLLFVLPGALLITILSAIYIVAGEVTIVTGHTGSGKSAFTTALLTQVAAAGVPSVGASFELTATDFTWRIMQRIVGKYPHARRDGSGAHLAMSPDDREAGIEVLQEMPLYLVDKFGGLPVAEYIDAMRFAQRRYDASFFLLDHLHFMTQGAGDREQYVLKDAIHALKDAARELDVALWVVCHPSRHARDKKTPEATDLHGSASLEQVADNILSVRRIVPENFDDPPMAQIYLLKLRRGRSGKLGNWTMEFNRAAESMQETGTGFRPITLARGVAPVGEQGNLSGF